MASATAIVNSPVVFQCLTRESFTVVCARQGTADTANKKDNTRILNSASRNKNSARLLAPTAHGNAGLEPLLTAGANAGEGSRLVQPSLVIVDPPEGIERRVCRLRIDPASG